MVFSILFSREKIQHLFLPVKLKIKEFTFVIRTTTLKYLFSKPQHFEGTQSNTHKDIHIKVFKAQPEINHPEQRFL